MRLTTHSAFLAAAALGLALTCGFTTAGIAAPADALRADTAQLNTTETLSAQQKRKRTVKRPRARSSGGQIACTPAGCHRIPPNCRPQTGYRWDGMPSGFDVVVCR